MGLLNPCRSGTVRVMPRGVKRMRAIAHRRVKPLLREELFRVLDAMRSGSDAARPNAAFLLLQNAGQCLRLECPSKKDALLARDTLPNGESTFGIQTNLLLGGIQTALKQAFNSGHSA